MSTALIVIGVFVTAVVVLCIVFFTSRPRALNYRLGDAVRLVGLDGVGARFSARFVYPDSIASKYVQRTSRVKDWNTLNAILEETFAPNNDNREKLMHLRLGDVTCANSEGAKERRPPLASDIAEYLKREGAEDAVIMSGNHSGTCVRETEEYLAELSALLPGATILYDDTGTSSSADKDLSRMVNAGQFFSGKGGFSEIATELRRLRGKPTMTTFS